MNNRNYNATYDLFRVIACAMIFSAHFVDVIGANGALADVIHSGASSLAIFFMLSGYFAFDSLSRTDNTIKWLKKRYIRILPVYWIALILMLVNILWFLGVEVNYGDSSFWVSYISAFIGINQYIPGYWKEIPIVGAMPIFILFYALAPIVYKYVKSIKQALVVVAISYVLQFILLHMNSFLGCGIFAYFYEFAMGIAIYQATKENKEEELMRIFLVVLFVWGILGKQGGFYFALICALVLISFNKLSIDDATISSGIRRMAKPTMDVWLGHGVAFNLVRTMESRLEKTFCFLVLSIVLSAVLYLIEIAFSKRIIK